MKFDVNKIRNDFPILNTKAYGYPLVYFDNAATTQKPQSVLKKMNETYTQGNANIHRGSHYLSDRATTEYEDTRKLVKLFINASSENEIIFTSGATESINLVAYSFGEKYIEKRDEIIISEMEHHANIVPWQIVCERKKAKLRIIPVKKGELDISVLNSLITKQTKIIAIKHVCNALGTINPVEEIITKAKEHNIPVLIDGTQAVPHKKVDVQKLDCDFFVFSAHKMYAPNGVGVLYGKKKWLDSLPPYKTGGEMIDKVKLEKSTYSAAPLKFEAGTTNYPAIIALKEAIYYIQNIGIDTIVEYENELLNYATQKIQEVEGLTIVGTPSIDNKISIISFLIDGVHNYDIGTLLDKYGIAIRTGHHCCHPLMDSLGIEGTARLSLTYYNTKEEIDLFCKRLQSIVKILKK